MVHVNPLTTNDGKEMSWHDAVIVAFVCMLAAYSIQFLSPWTYQQIIANPGEFIFKSIQFLLAVFFGILGSLKGLSKYYEAKKD